MAADGTPLSHRIRGTLTVEEVSQGTVALEQELATHEPGDPGSTTENIGVPATVDPEHAQNLARLDELLDQVRNGEIDVEDDGGDVAVYADPDELAETDDEDSDEGEEQADEDQDTDSTALTIPEIGEFKPTEADQIALRQIWQPAMEELGLDAEQQAGLPEMYARLGAAFPALACR
jgi:hypothetical protein